MPGTAFELEGPLFTPRLVWNEADLSVNIQLDESFWGGLDVSALLALCSYVNILSERERMYANPHEGVDQETLDKLTEMLGEFAPGMHPLEGAQETCMGNLYPELLYLLSGEDIAESPRPNSQPGNDYLAYMSHLNQLLMMATQLHHDATSVSNHKYIAHQLALLYQCMNQVRAETRPLKKRVEEKFDDIKSITEQSKQPGLTDVQKGWLTSITWDVRKLLVGMPAGIRAKLSPVVTFLGENPSLASPSGTPSANSAATTPRSSGTQGAGVQQGPFGGGGGGGGGPGVYPGASR